MTALALYFGSLGHGHFLYGNENPRREAPDGFPWTIVELCDGGLLENRRVPDSPDGRVHWTCGGKPVLWLAFFWWDRSEDHRSNSNSGFYVRGFDIADRAAALAFACAKWPKVVERQQHPLVLVELEHAR